MKFGFWTFLGKTELNRFNQVKYLCRCDCGVERFVVKYNLVGGNSRGCQSCSAKKRSLDGRKFGKLTVLKYVKNKKSECICDCGNKIIVNDSSLLKGNTKSCGCISSISRETYDEDMLKKLMGKIKKSEGCWEWQGSVSSGGYGHFPYKNKCYPAHRISWKLFKGEIPENMNVCHKCDNPSCVNPEHLFLGTQRENMKDMFSKNRKDHAQENHPRVKLSKENVLEIRDLIKQGFSQEIICHKFGITNGHVGSIKHRRTWKNL